MNKYLWGVVILILFIRIFVSIDFKDTISDGTKVKLSGRVSSEPYKYERSQSVLVNGYYAYLPLYPEINYGDELIVEGVVEGHTLKDPQLISLKKNNNRLLTFRLSVLSVYESSLPQDHAALVAGMSIGSKGLITKEFRDKLRNTGTAHVVVASGMNVALVAGFLINLLIGFINRNKAIIIAFIGIWIYSFLAGFDAPIIRAAIMASLTLSAQKLGRLNYAWRTLFITVYIMLFIKPEWIIDLGFVLSVSATASLMLFESKIRRRLHIVPKIIREDLSTTLAAQVLVAPILFIYFGDFNLVAPLINAIVLWTVPLITTIGIFAGVIGIVSGTLGSTLLYLIYPLTWWFTSIIEVFS